MDDMSEIKEEDIAVPVLNRHEDSYGSWIEVPIVLLLLLNLPPSTFTQESIVGEDSMYLDELLDADTFLCRFLYLYGTSPEMSDTVNHGDCANMIRSLPRNREGRAVTVH